MGRPDLSAVRRDEILDALERCVASAGLEGTSLDAIAREAGVKRQLIRHYLGNREEVIRAFGRRLIDRLHADIGLMVAAMPARGRAEAVAEMLLGEASEGAGDSAASTLLLESMIAAAEREPEFKELVSGYVEALTAAVAEQLELDVPDAGGDRCWEAAYGLVCLCFNEASLRPLGLPGRYRLAARASARELIAALRRA